MRAAFVALLLVFAITSCGSTQEKESSFSGSSAEKDRIVASITQERMAIEARKGQLTRKEMPTESLNARIKQKWSKLDFYSENGNLLRVKSYPYAQISSRTEEFYFRDGKLIFAYIEDDGMQGEGGGMHTKGKEYYYNDGLFVAERNMSGESERSVRNSDAEKLQAEALEYQELFKSKS